MRLDYSSFLSEDELTEINSRAQDEKDQTVASLIREYALVSSRDGEDSPRAVELVGILQKLAPTAEDARRAVSVEEAVPAVEAAPVDVEQN